MEVGKSVLPGVHLFIGQFKEVNDPEMHLSHRIAVVIEEGNNALCRAGGEPEFLLDLAFHTSHVGGVAKGIAAFIDGIDVATNAEGAEGVKPAFAT